jgi:hypothetical protein
MLKAPPLILRFGAENRRWALQEKTKEKSGGGKELH